jgi:hypothetical protein
MAFKDYSSTPAANTSLGDGTYIGPDMARNDVRPALQQLAADGKDLANTVTTLAVDGINSDPLLRADLAGNTGASLVQTSSGATVEVALASTRADTAERNAIDLAPVMLDLHMEMMRGAGWQTTDPGDGAVQKASTFAGSAAAGAASVTVASATFFKANQLIAFRGADGQWDTTRVSSVSGTTLNLSEQLPRAVAMGGQIGTFFNDYNHPREYGRWAIGDWIARTLSTATKRELVAAQRDYLDWKPLLGGAVAAATGVSYSNPGSDLIGAQAASVTCSAQYDGAITLPLYCPAGVYEVEVAINPGTNGGGANTVRLFVQEEFGNTTAFVHQLDAGAVLVTGTDSIQKVKLRFTKSKASRVQLYARQEIAGTSVFIAGTVRWYRVDDNLASLDGGTCVVMADSWTGGAPWIVDQLATRFTHTTFINKGVSGNKASDLLTRFDADVIPYSPRTVLIIVGTNDWAASIDFGTFSAQIGALIRRCQQIGAQPVLLNCSVGSLTDMSGTPVNQLRDSRRFAAALEYEVARPADLHTPATVYRGDTITLAAGAKQILFVSPAPTNRGAIVDAAQWQTSAAGLQIRYGFSTVIDPASLPATLADEIAFGATTAERVKDWVPNTDPTTRKYFLILAANTTGGSQTLTYHGFRVRVADLA